MWHWGNRIGRIEKLFFAEGPTDEVFRGKKLEAGWNGGCIRGNGRVEFAEAGVVFFGCGTF
ncbi:hypothetical protein D3C76_1620760 [compost metagenome]